MKCPHCGKEHSDTAKFCEYTGKPIESQALFCNNPKCTYRSPLPLSAKFCPNCRQVLSTPYETSISEHNESALYDDINDEANYLDEEILVETTTDEEEIYSDDEADDSLDNDNPNSSSEDNTSPKKRRKLKKIFIGSFICIVSLYLVGYIGDRFYRYISDDDWDVANVLELKIGVMLGSRGALFTYGRALSDKRESAEYIMEAARKGHIWAQYYLAMAYKKGKGIRKDPEQAFYWFKKSAEKDLNRAQLALGECYEEGIGVGVDLNEAFKWYMESATNIHRELDDAMVKVGDCYFEGKGVPKNRIKAVEWYQKAAKTDTDDEYAISNREALYKLGLCYINGDGISEDYFKGYNLIRDAAERNFKPAKEFLRLDSITADSTVIEMAEVVEAEIVE